MTSNYTSFQIDDFILRRDGTDLNPGRVLLGQNQVWPKAKVIEFKTFQKGGSLDFTIGSDTKYAAVTIDDSDVFIFSTSNTHKNYVESESSTYYNKYTMSNTFTPIQVSIPLYLKKDVKITGKGTQVGRYGGDYNSGSVTVTVRLGIGQAESFSVQVTGKGTKTLLVPAGQSRFFVFSGLSQGNKTVTITNNASGDTYTRTVNINTYRGTLASQTFLIGAESGDVASIGTIEKSVKIYSLTEAEALANLQASYGSEAIIGVDARWMLADNEKNYPTLYNGSSFPNTGGSHCYWIVFFKILHGGTGYPANTRIGIVDMGEGNGINIVYDAGKGGVYSRPAFFRHADLVTNSNGTITSITRDTYANARFLAESVPADFIAVNDQRRNRLLDGGYAMADLGYYNPGGSSALEYNAAGPGNIFFPPTGLGGYLAAGIVGGVQRNLNPNITPGSWRHYQSNLYKSGQQRAPSASIPSNLHSSIKYWHNIVPHDFYYVAANKYSSAGSRSGDVLKWIKQGVEGTDGRVIKFPGANNKTVNLVWTGSHPDNISAQLGGGKWFNNLLVDSTDGVGNIESIAFDNTELSNILVQNQPEFQVLQSDKIQTSINKSSNTNVQINASKKFKAMHGNGIDYTYTDS